MRVISRDNLPGYLTVSVVARRKVYRTRSLLSRRESAAIGNHALTRGGLKVVDLPGETSLPVTIRKALDNRGHPSLHAKKYSETLDLWQGRVTRDWRFYFKIGGDEYVIISIIPLPK